MWYYTYVTNGGNMKTILAICVLVISAAAWSDDPAAVTFSGKGKNGIEVRDASGQVTDVIGTSTLRLNQIPADAVAREEAYRAKRRQLAADSAKRRAEISFADEKAAAEALAAAEKADADAAVAAAADAKKFEEEHPRKVRRTTVRGNRYTPKPADSAAPAPAAEPPQVVEEAPAAEADPTEAPSPK